MIWIFVYFVCAIPFIIGQDPCTDSGTATLSRSIFDVPFCDASLSPMWYKIDEKTGEDIHTECVTFGTCGTVYPLWMNGSIPTVAAGIVDRTVCQVTPGICCNKTYNIQVKNCGDFRVYKLMYTDGCYQAYCIKASDKVNDCGKRANFKCDSGNSSTLVAIVIVVVVCVVVVSIIVWCFFRRRPSGQKKPILSDGKGKQNTGPPIVYDNRSNLINESTL